MNRRIHRTLVWFGAVAALLALSLPAHADQLESDPFVEEEVEPGSERKPVEEAEAEEEKESETEAEPGRNISKFIDIVIVRPLYFARLVVGLPFFIAYPFTIASGYDEDVIALLWTEPYEATFKRPLGETPADF